MANDLQRVVNKAAKELLLEKQKKAREDKAQAIAEFCKKVQKFLPNLDEWDFYIGQAVSSGTFQNPETEEEISLKLTISDSDEGELHLRVLGFDDYAYIDDVWLFSQDDPPEALINHLANLILKY